MPALLSAIGSRGDSQPLLALAVRLRVRHEARLCVPPDLRDWIEDLGFPVTPLSAAQRGTVVADWPPREARSSPGLLRELVEAAVADEFAVLATARGPRPLVSRPAPRGGCSAKTIKRLFPAPAQTRYMGIAQGTSQCRPGQLRLTGSAQPAAGAPLRRPADYVTRGALAGYSTRRAVPTCPYERRQLPWIF